jgi:von Willebrand factor type A domain
VEELQGAWSWQRGISGRAWLLSLLLHFTAMATVGWTTQKTPQGAAGEPTREGGIVLVARGAGHAEYFADARAESATTEHSALFPEKPAVFAPSLPATGAQVVAASHLEAVPTPAARPQPASAGGPIGRGQGSAIETRVFGVPGKGTRFVYVFDRSSSMEGAPLAAAKRELIASLQSLQGVHQFQIIFYNQEPQLMPVFRGPSRQMVFGDEPGKRLAASFIGGISAYGATDHMQALRTALQMRPDVVFFLTDANEPQLRVGDLATIRQWNQGATINAIEFGVGAAESRYSFLHQLAAENGGQHAYINVTRLR